MRHQWQFIASLVLTLLLTACGESGTGWNWWSKDKATSAPESDSRESAEGDLSGDAPPSATRPEAVQLSAAPGDSEPAAPATGRKPPAGAIQPDALLVNNEPVRVIDILEPLNPRLSQLAKELPAQAYYQQAAQLVRVQIVEAVAQQLIWRRAQAHLTDELQPAIEKAVDKMEKERINREFGGRETVYEKYIASQGRSREDVRERLKRTIVIDSYLRERLLPLVPTPRRDELLAHYKSNLKDYRIPARREMFLMDFPVRSFVKSRNVFGPRPEDVTAAWQKARQAAADAKAALTRGESFDAVARQYSMGPKKDEGGAWGFITEPEDKREAPLQGRWEKPSIRLFQLAGGQVSEVIEDEPSQSLFIVKCGAVEGGGTTSFQDAQPRLVDALRQQRFVKLRADFLQAELEKSTLGSLDEFMAMVMDAIPEPADRLPPGRPR